MKPFLKILSIGLLISFLGSLPLGTMNIVATEISIQLGKAAAILFCVGAVVIEIMYVRLALTAMDKIVKHPVLFRFCEWLSVIMILVLATASFIAAKHFAGLGHALPVNVSHPFLFGVLLSATNPLHVTFWFGWSTILIDKGILIPKPINYNLYIAGIGLGSITGYLVFIEGGNYIINKLRVNQQTLNWLIGAVLFLTGIVQLIKIIRKSMTTAIQHDS
jgi:threonine/homoserine/homoserine lactone efflux protein